MLYFLKNNKDVLLQKSVFTLLYVYCDITDSETRLKVRGEMSRVLTKHVKTNFPVASSLLATVVT